MPYFIKGQGSLSLFLSSFRSFDFGTSPAEYFAALVLSMTATSLLQLITFQVRNCLTDFTYFLSE